LVQCVGTAGMWVRQCGFVCQGIMRPSVMCAKRQIDISVALAHLGLRRSRELQQCLQWWPRGCLLLVHCCSWRHESEGVTRFRDLSREGSPSKLRADLLHIDSGGVNVTFVQ
jgi:hypothetical protein